MCLGNPGVRYLGQDADCWSVLWSSCWTAADQAGWDPEAFSLIVCQEKAAFAPIIIARSISWGCIYKSSTPRLHPSAFPICLFTTYFRDWVAFCRFVSYLTKAISGANREYFSWKLQKERSSEAKARYPLTHYLSYRCVLWSNKTMWRTMRTMRRVSC